MLELILDLVISMAYNELKLLYQTYPQPFNCPNYLILPLSRLCLALFPLGVWSQ
jgi:hypothetical protein